MEPGSHIAHGLRDIRSDPALVRESAIPVGDGMRARLHDELAVDVQPEVGAGAATDHEVRLITRQARRRRRVAISRRGTQNERVHTHAIDLRDGRPDDPAEARGGRGQSSRINLLRTRLRGGRRGGNDCENQRDEDAAEEHQGMVEPTRRRVREDAKERQRRTRKDGASRTPVPPTHPPRDSRTRPYEGDRE